MGGFRSRDAGRASCCSTSPFLPPSCCSRALAAVIPCSGLKISPGAAAAHRRLEVVINNPGGWLTPASRRSGPCRLLWEEVGVPVLATRLEGWMDRWRRVGKQGRSSLCPLAARGN